MPFQKLTMALVLDKEAAREYNKLSRSVMPITGQQGSWLWARDLDDPHSHSVTIQVRNRDVFAEIALFDVFVADEEFHSTMCGISQIVSDSGVENFELPDRPLAFRTNVTSITFRVHVINAQASARWMLHFWS
jgi:hypothetical protein